MYHQNSQEPALLELKGVSKSFGSNLVLSGVSLKARSGEVLALLGDNGAGKSTLIKIISGFHRPDAGSMYWQGQSIDLGTFDPQNARAHGIQTVYQHLGLVDELSLTRNFFLGLEPTRQIFGIRHLDHSRMREVVRHEISKLGIRRRLDPDDPVAKLSGGERQVIAIARAKYFGAKLLILDEPTSALSLKQTEGVLDFIKQSRDAGLAVVVITHAMHQVERVADRVSIIYHGANVGHFDKSNISRTLCEDLIMHGQASRPQMTQHST